MLAATLDVAAKALPRPEPGSSSSPCPASLDPLPTPAPGPCLQGMLLQIAANWRALHPVVRPRAVWVCCYHLHFKSVLDGAWNSCADASE